MKHKIHTLIVLLLNFAPLSALHAQDTLTTFGFVDTYSGYSPHELPTDERPYFTQASRNSDYHLNLASGGFAYDDQLLRAKLIGQYGESVSINYNAEPHDSFKYVQESYLGAYLDQDTTLDVGTFLAHIGAESWLSKDNLNYTRSYIAEFSPYYESGVRLGHKFSDQYSGQILGVNGWQNTSDNRHPALGTQLAYQRNNLNLVSNTFFGSENYGNRVFHDLIATLKFDSGLTLTNSFDVGHQTSSSAASGTWWGYSIMGKLDLSDRLAVNARFESYSDPHAVIVTSISGQDFVAKSTSAGFDFRLGAGFMLRSELKYLWSQKSIFPDNEAFSKDDTLMLVSLSYFDEHKF